MSWIVAMCKANQESIAEYNLTRQGYEHYCPRFQQKVPNKPTLIKPLFPRYIFILIDKVWHSIKGTRGISHVLLSDNGPQSIPETVINEIKSREQNGFVNLSVAPKFKPGEQVKTSEGPLAGLLLVYEGMSSNDRVKVLANILGRKVVVTLPENSLAAA